MDKIVIDHNTPDAVRNEYFQTYPRSGASTSGVRNVYPTKSGRWMAAYRLCGRIVRVGTFNSVQEARDALVASKKKVGLI